MSRRSLSEELEILMGEIEKEFFIVLDMLDRARDLVENHSGEAYRTIMDMEDTINRMEVDIESHAIKLLALYQPEAGDLRTIITAIKVNNDLERAADHVENIARDIHLMKKDGGSMIVDVSEIYSKTRRNFQDAIDAFLRKDTREAREIIMRDSDIDRLRDRLIEEIVGEITIRPEIAPSALKALNIVQNFERIADLATNIAEDTIFWVEGIIFRHGIER